MRTPWHSAVKREINRRTDHCLAENMGYDEEQTPPTMVV
jgi:hypothetical protein